MLDKEEEWFSMAKGSVDQHTLIHDQCFLDLVNMACQRDVKQFKILRLSIETTQLCGFVLSTCPIP